MNKDKLRGDCLKLKEKTNLNFNVIETYYFLEKILEKIARSKENKNFIFKGGFLLSSYIGIKERTTMDIDFDISGFSLNEDTLRKKLNNILSDDKDDIKYEIIKIEDIRKEEEYGGLRVFILANLDNIKITIPLDIATGDLITPSSIEYKYKSIFNDKEFNIYAYNLETILAEKIETIYKRGVFNSRSKDFYDLYIIYKIKNR